MAKKKRFKAAEGEMSKSAAVRAVMDTGITSPTEISTKVREQYGIDVKPSHVSTIKNQMKKKKDKGGRKGKRKAVPAGANSAFAAAIEYVQRVGSLDEAQAGLDMIRTAKSL